MVSDGDNLVCFTNCFLATEDGRLVERDLWVDEQSGVILDAQKTFYQARKRPTKLIDLKGNILSPGFIDIQINGAYGFDFSIYNGDDEQYKDGLKMVSRKIVETGVTSLVPTLITQEKALYPKLLSLLGPLSLPNSAHLLGWHAEGPFLQPAKRGAHAIPYIISAPNGFETFEEVYGAQNLEEADGIVRMITAAPEIEGVMDSVGELVDRGIIFSIGHSIASSPVATAAVRNGASLITHLFNAMPQLHHRDPSIIGLLGATGIDAQLTSGTAMPSSRTPSRTPSRGPSRVSSSKQLARPASIKQSQSNKPVSEALEELPTPPQTPTLAATLTKSDGVAFERPFYGIIVDGIHSHPNSVRLAYSSHPEGCILVTDAMAFLDPHLPNGPHAWRDGKRLVKEGDKLYIEGTETLAGSVVTLDTCVRNFARFTATSLAEAIVCATYHPARCLGIENRKGTLKAGADADLVVLDAQGSVLETWVKGKRAYSK